MLVNVSPSDDMVYDKVQFLKHPYSLKADYRLLRNFMLCSMCRFCVMKFLRNRKCKITCLPASVSLSIREQENVVVVACRTKLDGSFQISFIRKLIFMCVK